MWRRLMGGMVGVGLLVALLVVAGWSLTPNEARAYGCPKGCVESTLFAEAPFRAYDYETETAWDRDVNALETSEPAIRASTTETVTYYKCGSVTVEACPGEYPQAPQEVGACDFTTPYTETKTYCKEY